MLFHGHDLALAIQFNVENEVRRTRQKRPTYKANKTYLLGKRDLPIACRTPQFNVQDEVRLVVCVCVCIFMYIYTYTYIYRHRYAYTHTYIHFSSSSSLFRILLLFLGLTLAVQFNIEDEVRLVRTINSQRLNFRNNFFSD